MMLGVSGLIVVDGAAPVVANSDGSNIGVEKSGGGGGNRWPKQETSALLKIRSDMNVTFKDASLKGPLWEEVSRKMGELGFHRSAKKCKEKFENVYKYYKRTKDGQSSKPHDKTYHFFDQLAALENTHFNNFTPLPPSRPYFLVTAPPPLNNTIPTSHDSISSTSPTPLSIAPPKIATNQIINLSSSQPPVIKPAAIPPPQSLFSNSTSSSTFSDEDIQNRQGRKRKWNDYFEKLLKDVVNKQEELQKKFLEILEKQEHDRIAREEAWRVREIARMNREHDQLVQERSISAAKNAAIITFLQKVTDENANMQIPVTNNDALPKILVAPPQLSHLPVTELPSQPIVAVTPTKVVEALNRDNPAGNRGVRGGLIPSSSSQWPKAEVEAFTKVQTDLELEYQDNMTKASLWENNLKAIVGLGYNAVKSESPMVAIMARADRPQSEQNLILREGDHDIDKEKNHHNDKYEDDDQVGGHKIITDKQVTNRVE